MKCISSKKAAEGLLFCTRHHTSYAPSLPDAFYLYDFLSRNPAFFCQKGVLHLNDFLHALDFLARACHFIVGSRLYHRLQVWSSVSLIDSQCEIFSIEIWIDIIRRCETPTSFGQQEAVISEVTVRIIYEYAKSHTPPQLLQVISGITAEGADTFRNI